MEEDLDYEGEKIKEGFYNHYEYNILFYFTGKYDIEDLPIFEIEGGDKNRHSLYPNLIQQLVRIDKEKIKKEMKESPEKASWIERRLKE
jgi:hypothetical protein